MQGYLEMKSSSGVVPAAWSRFLSYGWDWVPLEDRSRVLSFAEPLRCRTPPLPPMPPPSARSPHSHLSPPPSERLEFWRVGVPWGRPFFSSGKGSGEENRKVTLGVYVLYGSGQGMNEMQVGLKKLGVSLKVSCSIEK